MLINQEALVELHIEPYHAAEPSLFSVDSHCIDNINCVIQSGLGLVV